MIDFWRHYFFSNGIFNFEIFCRLFISAILGFVIGFDRLAKRKPADIKTYTYVSISSCLITVISIYSFQMYGHIGVKVNMDPMRLAAQIVSGLGFLGAGLIIKDGMRIKGLTSAAMDFFTGSVGIGIGAGFYGIVISAVGITRIISFVGNKLERRVADTSEKKTSVKKARRNYDKNVEVSK
ncbi:MgtC/SapB family protein [Neobacillus ginsengisoli]|uniref:Mg2+ transporter-C (MgtC) family protein n=1 Tax=Neobacillus ginsengisoli TaxID=904295 RepID=A0ABT9Y1J7_9BACI|nr:MgtC/SapB family protein [Neobacillus ginsengisoli]MDQ0201694.1 putative Mg2+ transporter-C (MgtC) family protein [Neobacillus ginsengisoli]